MSGHGLLYDAGVLFDQNNPTTASSSSSRSTHKRCGLTLQDAGCWGPAAADPTLPTCRGGSRQHDDQHQQEAEPRPRAPGKHDSDLGKVLDYINGHKLNNSKAQQPPAQYNSSGKWVQPSGGLLWPALARQCCCCCIAAHLLVAAFLQCSLLNTRTIVG
jgi:hypothetical protein